jgi:hypothetical protein
MAKRQIHHTVLDQLETSATPVTGDAKMYASLEIVRTGAGKCTDGGWKVHKQ